MRFRINIDYQPFHEGFKNQSEFIRQSLKKVGIDVNVRTQDLAGFIKRVYSDYDFDIDTGRWVPMMDPQIGGLRQYSTANITPGVPWSNASNYSSPAMDKVIAALQGEIDPTRRQQGFYEFQRIAQRDLPVVPLFEQQNFTVYSKRLQGVSVEPDGALSSSKTCPSRPNGALPCTCNSLTSTSSSPAPARASA